MEVDEAKIKKCRCTGSTCAKCLSINCEDKNWATHTNELKKTWRERDRRDDSLEWSERNTIGGK